MDEKKILIVEDENTIRDMVQFALAPAGFTIIEAGDIAQAEKHLITCLPDLILLDWMLPDRSGIAFVKQLKRHPRYQHIPIIMLTAKAEEENKIKGLEIGADDYITKPFSPRELIARIKTVLRRGPSMVLEGVLTLKGLSLNSHTRDLKIAGKSIKLSPIEYKLLYFFMGHLERVYTRAQLLDYVWGTENFIDERTVDVQIRRLRNCLKPYGYDTFIQTVRGSGYQFTVKAL